MLYRWKVRFLKHPRLNLLWRRWRARHGDVLGSYDRLPEFIRNHAPGKSFAQALAPLRLLPIGWFVAAWTLVLTATLAWTARRLAIALLLFQPVIASIALGNVEILIAAAIVAGFRWPAAWAFVLLSKVTPGIGLVWFAVRREWRSLAIALAVTAAIVAVSFALAPTTTRGTVVTPAG